MKKYAFMTILALLLISCQQQDSKICARYQGTLPAADGPGIDTSLNFNPDHTFEAQFIYIDKKDGSFKTNGTYRIRGSIIETTASGESPVYYKIEKHQLRQLDRHKKIINGSLGEYYLLKHTGQCNK